MAATGRRHRERYTPRGGRVVLFAILGKQSQDGLGVAHQILKQKTC